MAANTTTTHKHTVDFKFSLDRQALYLLADKAHIATRPLTPGAVKTPSTTSSSATSRATTPGSSSRPAAYKQARDAFVKYQYTTSTVTYVSRDTQTASGIGGYRYLTGRPASPRRDSTRLIYAKPYQSAFV